MGMSFEPEVYYYNLFLYWKRVMFENSSKLEDIRDNETI